MKFVQLLVLGLVVWAAVGVVGQAADLGETAFLQGRFEEAAAYWEKALSNPSPGITATDMIEITVRLASAYQELGRLQMAHHLLTQPALCEQIEGLKDFDLQNEAKARILSQLSEVYVALPDDLASKTSKEDDQKVSVLPACLSSIANNQQFQDFCNPKSDTLSKTDKEKKNIDKALDYACQSLSVVPWSRAWLKANFFNNIGNILTTRKDYREAITAYRKSADLANNSGDNGLFIKARLNSIQLRLNCGENCPDEFDSEKPCTLLSSVDKLPDSHDKIFALISLANLEKEQDSSESCQQDKKQFREKVLTEAKKLAEALHDKNALGYTHLYLAELEAEECGQRETANCYSGVIGLIEETLKRQAQSYPLLQKFSTHGTEQFWIRQADSFVSSRFNWPFSQNVEPALQEKCKDWCKQYSSPCVQDKLPDECKEVCRSGPTLFLRDYHPELSFRLEWQRGKIYKAQYDTEKRRDAETQGKIQKDVEPNGQARLQMAFEAKAKEQLQKAIDAYDNAANYLQMVRQTYGSISKKFGLESDFYRDRADLLIQAAKVATKEDDKQNLLKAAIDSIESRQEADLRNYFQDECITEKEKTEKERLEERPLPNNEVLLYLVTSDDRVESVLKFGDGSIQQKTRDCATTFCKDGYSLKIWIHTFRESLIQESSIQEDNTNISSLIVEPLMEMLNERKQNRVIDTLRIVPTGDLLKIPFAALQNDGKYLVDNYAIAVLLSWRLSNVPYSPINLEQDPALLAGLIIEQPGNTGVSKDPSACAKKQSNVKNAAGGSRNICTIPLCYVEVEIKGIQNLIPSSQPQKTLLREDFTVAKLEDSLKSQDYSILHLSTHGYFDESSDKSWLCTHNVGEELTLDKLKEILQRKQGLKLLTLSACQTALGAELGLAGIGVKSGTQGTLGTLWSVNDESTSKLMQKFFENLKRENLKNNLAKALRDAQLQVKKYYPEPHYWAGFVLIGNR